MAARIVRNVVFLGRAIVRFRAAARAVGLVAIMAWPNLAPVMPGGAQTSPKTDTAALEAKKAALFQRMLADPANLEITFAYAEIAAQLGDNEAAVSALERM